jgi:GNAT superfamily N-acetyltransferase
MTKAEQLFVMSESTENTCRIALATTAEEIERCCPVMRELRSQVAEKDFVARVQKQQKEGYQLGFLEKDGAIRAVAGFRILELLFSGRTLYVDDLVTRASDRSQGFGEMIFAWLLERARGDGCESLTLDSGVQRYDAHRFYLRQRMEISAHHFSLEIKNSRSKSAKR